jgi:hypothetical protein
MTISSVYIQKMVHAANSSRKRSALETFIPSMVDAHNPKAQHPAKNWFKSSTTSESNQVLAGTATALLTIKKPDKIVYPSAC